MGRVKRQLESIFNEICYYTNQAGDAPLEILKAIVAEYELSDVYDKWLENRDAEDDGIEIPHPQAVDDAKRLLEAFEDALEQCQFKFEERIK